MVGSWGSPVPESVQVEVPKVAFTTVDLRVNVLDSKEFLRLRKAQESLRPEGRGMVRDGRCVPLGVLRPEGAPPGTTIGARKDTSAGTAPSQLGSVHLGTDVLFPHVPFPGWTESDSVFEREK